MDARNTRGAVADTRESARTHVALLVALKVRVHAQAQRNDDAVVQDDEAHEAVPHAAVEARRVAQAQHQARVDHAVDQAALFEFVLVLFLLLCRRRGARIGEQQQRRALLDRALLALAHRRLHAVQTGRR